MIEKIQINYLEKLVNLMKNKIFHIDLRLGQAFITLIGLAFFKIWFEKTYIQKIKLLFDKNITISNLEKNIFSKIIEYLRY